MSLTQRVAYTVVCDTCGRRFGYFEGAKYSPQQVLRIVDLEYGWYVDDELTICVGCPQPTDELDDGEPPDDDERPLVGDDGEPLCSWCGLGADECECAGGMLILNRGRRGQG